MSAVAESSEIQEISVDGQAVIKTPIGKLNLIIEHVSNDNHPLTPTEDNLAHKALLQRKEKKHTTGIFTPTFLGAIASSAATLGEIIALLGLIAAMSNPASSFLVAGIAGGFSIFANLAWLLVIYKKSTLKKQDKTRKKDPVVITLNGIAAFSCSIGGIVSISSLFLFGAGAAAPAVMVMLATSLILAGSVCWVIAAFKEKFISWKDYAEKHKKKSPDVESYYSNLSLSMIFNGTAAVSATIGAFISVIGVLTFSIGHIPILLMAISSIFLALSGVAWMASVYSGYRAKVSLEKAEVQDTLIEEENVKIDEKIKLEKTKAMTPRFENKKAEDQNAELEQSKEEIQETPTIKMR